MWMIILALLSLILAASPVAAQVPPGCVADATAGPKGVKCIKTLDAAALPDGIHVLSAEAVDLSGNKTTVSAEYLAQGGKLYGKDKPIVTMSVPVAVPTPISITLSAAENGPGIATVTFFLDGAPQP